VQRPGRWRTGRRAPLRQRREPWSSRLGALTRPRSPTSPLCPIRWGVAFERFGTPMRQETRVKARKVPVPLSTSSGTKGERRGPCEAPVLESGGVDKPRRLWITLRNAGCDGPRDPMDGMVAASLPRRRSRSDLSRAAAESFPSAFHVLAARRRAAPRHRVFTSKRGLGVRDRPDGIRAARRRIHAD
jgi:hypothetical protein